MAKDKITKTVTPKAPKTKTTETSTTKAPKNKTTGASTTKSPKTNITRVDNTEWKTSSPAAGGEQSWSDWAKSNPNRPQRAKLADDRYRKTPRETSKTNRFKEDGKTPDPKREEAVKNWQDKRPVSGKGASKSEEEKEIRRKKMIKWAKDNPNARDNARTTLGRKLTRDGKTDKKKKDGK
jgi:hypothetical protein